MNDEELSPLTVIPGRVEDASPESRSGLDARLWIPDRTFGASGMTKL
jgi:hypothetical protein